MSRPVVGVMMAVHPARFGPWDQDVAMVPATVVAAVNQLGWLAVLVTADSVLAAEPEEAIELLDGLIVPDWGEADRYGELSRTVAETARAHGLPVLRLQATLLAPDRSVADYVLLITDLFGPERRAASV